jgi:hypothetical protein
MDLAVVQQRSRLTRCRTGRPGEAARAMFVYLA